MSTRKYNFKTIKSLKTNKNTKMSRRGKNEKLRKDKNIEREYS